MSYSQCSTNTIITSSKTEYLDAKDSVQHTEMEKTIIEIAKLEINIAPGDDKERVMHGKITSTVCVWSKPFKEGKTVIEAVFVNRTGETKNGTITIEGKDGKIIFLLQAAENPEFKVRVLADKFEEKK